ncbi:MAG: helix-turn-helix domain-containing protein [Bacillota bacterium]
MLSMRDRLRRRMDALDLNQTRLSEISGISQGIISQILNNKQQSLSAENLRRLSQALQVPVVYWLTDSIPEYVASRVASRGQDELVDWDAWPPSRRIGWLINDIDACWGREYGTEALARTSRVSPDSIELMLKGKLKLTPHLLRAVTEVTGLPTVIFTGEEGHPPNGIPHRYAELAETAYTLGLDPDYVTEVLLLLSRRPPVVAPRPLSSKEKEPG